MPQTVIADMLKSGYVTTDDLARALELSIVRRYSLKYKNLSGLTMNEIIRLADVGKMYEQTLEHTTRLPKDLDKILSNNPLIEDIKEGTLWRLSPAVGFSDSILVHKIMIDKVDTHATRVVPYRLEGDVKLPTCWMETSELVEWIKDGIMTPLFIKEFATYVATEEFRIQTVHPQKSTDKYRRFVKGDLIYTGKITVDEYGDRLIDLDYHCDLSKDEEYKNGTKYKLLPDDNCRVDQLRLMLMKGCIKLVIKKDNRKLSHMPYDLPKGRRFEFDKKFIPMRPHSTVTVGQEYIFKKIHFTDPDTKYEKGTIIKIREIFGITIDFESQTQCSHVTQEHFMKMIRDGVIVLKNSDDNITELPEWCVKGTCFVVKSRVLNPDANTPANVGDKLYISAVAEKEGLVEFIRYEEKSNDARSFGWLMITHVSDFLKRGILVASDKEEHANSELSYKLHFKQGQLYEFTRDEEVTGPYGERCYLKTGTKVTIDKQLASVEKFDFGFDGRRMKLSREYLEWALKNGAIKLIWNSTGKEPWKPSNVLFDLYIGQRFRSPKEVFEGGACLFMKDEIVTISEIKNNGSDIFLEGRTIVFERTKLEKYINNGVLVPYADIKEGQIYRATRQVPENIDDSEILFKKDCKVEIVRARGDYVNVITEDDEKPKQIIVEKVIHWIDKGILVLEDEEIVIRQGHKYRVNRDIKANFTDDVRHKEGEILEVTQVDCAYVSYRVGEVNMRESVDKFRHLIALEHLVLVGSEFKGEMPCEFKNGMKFKFAKKFERFGDGCDFNPGDVIILDRVTNVKCIVLNMSGCSCGTFSIVWMQNAIKNGMLVPIVDDPASEDDMCFYDGEKFVAEMMFEFRPQDESIGSIVIDKGQLVTLGINRCAPEDKQLSLHRDGKLLCYISRCMLIRLIQHDRLKRKDVAK